MHDYVEYGEWSWTSLATGITYTSPLRYRVIRPPTEVEQKEEDEKDELWVRRMEAGHSMIHKEPDYTGERFVRRDRSDRKLFKEEFPDLKIKIRHRSYW